MTCPGNSRPLSDHFYTSSSKLGACLLLNLCWSGKYQLLSSYSKYRFHDPRVVVSCWLVTSHKLLQCCDWLFDPDVTLSDVRISVDSTVPLLRLRRVKPFFNFFCSALIPKWHGYSFIVKTYQDELPTSDQVNLPCVGQLLQWKRQNSEGEVKLVSLITV